LFADYDQPIRSGFSAGEVLCQPSGRVSVRNQFVDEVTWAYRSTSFQVGFAKSAQNYNSFFDNAEGSVVAPDDMGFFNDALINEFGVDAPTIRRIHDYFDKLCIDAKSTFIRMRRSDLFIARESLGVMEERLTLLIDNLRIYRRSSWDSELPSHCKGGDVFPWLFKRKFSLLRRPIVELDRHDDPTMIVSPLLFGQFAQYILTNTYHAEFPPSYFQSKVMKRFHDHATSRRGKEFVVQANQRLKEDGYETLVEVDAPRIGGDPILGDYDILAWKNSECVFAIECKALRNARSISEILSQLNEFKGEGKDKLVKQQKRVTWLSENKEGLSKLTKTSFKRVVGIVLTSHLVPMQFQENRDGDVGFCDFDSIIKVLGQS
jgi:hypothetical protein